MKTERLWSGGCEPGARLLRRAFWRILLTGAIFLAVLPPHPASALENWDFVRMWPTLEQPWYFYHPYGIAADREGYVYIADTENHRIQKFTKDGLFVTKWGKNGRGEGEFRYPSGIAADREGYLYIADTENDRIQKFTDGGEFVRQWGVEGSGPGEFDGPCAVAADRLGNLYAVDAGNDRIQKFTGDGEFLIEWGREESGESIFGRPAGIEVDGNGIIYVTDREKDRIMAFSEAGALLDPAVGGNVDSPSGIAADRTGAIFVAELKNGVIEKFLPDGTAAPDWGDGLEGASDLLDPQGVESDPDGYFYVADTGKSRILKFSAETGQLTEKWGTGDGPGELRYPNGIAMDGEGNLFVADTGHHRIQKFSVSGEFLEIWGENGSGEGDFNSPRAVAVYPAQGPAQRVLVADTLNSRIQSFTPDGQFIGQWGSYGAGQGELSLPRGIGAGPAGDLFVADSGNHRICRFSPNGEFLLCWGEEGAGEGEFHSPRGVALYTDGEEKTHVYVADTLNHRICRFTGEGVFEAQWGAEGTEPGMFSFPEAIAADRDGFCYVADMKNGRIQKFSPDGQLMAAFGEPGSDPGQFNFPRGIAAGPEGQLYVADSENHRIQVFAPAHAGQRNKAIIVAGGGAYPGNHLWDATRMCASNAYRTLTYQGFTKETVYYLSEETHLDLDNNGLADDVDGVSNRENLENAIRSWGKNADQLLLYLVDHGGDKTFRLNRTENLSAADLSGWLDEIQSPEGTKAVLIYDACESGSFLPELTPKPGVERILISSTGPEESAYFVGQGAVSFSNFFWSRVFTGKDLMQCFADARDALALTSGAQTPLIDDNGDGSHDAGDGETARQRTIGSGTTIPRDAPVIEAVVPEQSISGTDAADIWAKGVSDPDGIARVWAMIRPREVERGEAQHPVRDFPSVDLMPGADGRYSGTYDRFGGDGLYEITIRARDRKGYTSAPKKTLVRVNDPIREKAILVMGRSDDDPFSAALTGAGELAWEALKMQGYSDESIHLLHTQALSSVENDAVPTLENLREAVTGWGGDAKNLLLWLAGKGKGGGLALNSGEILSPGALDSWLDTLQEHMSGAVILICDFDDSGDFMARLSPPAEKTRIIIAGTSANRRAAFLPDGNISFSRFFWSRIAYGADLYSAFIDAKNAIGYATGQTPLLEDDGDSIPGGGADGLTAREIRLGAGLRRYENDPIISGNLPDTSLLGETSHTIRVEDVTAGAEIRRVWAVIQPPGQIRVPGVEETELPTVELIGKDGGYEGTWDGFLHYGDYRVAVYAEDVNGNIALPRSLRIRQTTGPDLYEPDDEPDAANVLQVSNPSADDLLAETGTWRHNFHASDDADWVKFFAVAGQSYDIRTDDPEADTDTVITLYESDGKTVIETRDDWRDSTDKSGELLSWKCPADGVYFVRITPHDPSVFGADTGYTLKIYVPIQGIPGFLTGRVTDASGKAVAGAVIRSDIGGAAITDAGGYFIMAAPSGAHDLTLTSDGFDPLPVAGLEIQGENLLYQAFELQQTAPPPTPEPLPDEAPIADAGPDRTVQAGENVILNGTGSYDPEGGTLSFFWETVSKEPSIEIPSPSQSRISVPIPPTLTAETEIIFQLTVTDVGGLSASDICTVKVQKEKTALAADAGPDREALSGEIVSLDGSGSVLPEGATVAIRWEQIKGAPVALSDPADLSPTFTAPEGSQTLVFRLTLTDEKGASVTDTGTVTVTEEPTAPGTAPIADAGGDQNVMAGETVQLDGSGSSDPEDDITRFLWEQTDGAVVTLSEPNTGITEFIAPMVEAQTELVFQLIVEDAAGRRSADTCTVSVFPDALPPAVHAGEDRSVAEGETVILKGAGSSASSEGMLSFRWTQFRGPAVVLSDPDSARTKFVTPVVLPDDPVILGFRLTAEEAGGLIGESEVFVTVQDNGIRLFPDDVLSFTTATGRPLGIRVQGSASITAVECTHPSDIEETYNRPWNLIYGLVEVRFLPVGEGPVRITVFFPEPAWHGDRPYRCFTYDGETGWRERRDAGFNENRDRMTLSLNPGGTRNLNGSSEGADEEISIRFAPGIVYEGEADGGSGGGGCFIESAAIVFFESRSW